MAAADELAFHGECGGDRARAPALSLWTGPPKACTWTVPCCCPGWLAPPPGPSSPLCLAGPHDSAHSAPASLTGWGPLWVGSELQPHGRGDPALLSGWMNENVCEPRDPVNGASCYLPLGRPKCQSPCSAGRLLQQVMDGTTWPPSRGPGSGETLWEDAGSGGARGTWDACWSKTVSKMKVFSRDRCARSVSSGSSPGSMSTTI